eukprot:6468755-Alexandrium_andersonii.AAC.1
MSYQRVPAKVARCWHNREDGCCEDTCILPAPAVPIVRGAPCEGGNACARNWRPARPVLRPKR